ncbi:MAG: amidohydrolase [Sphingobacteriia bacterium]|nr:amidohydrolase [Sphingobacteriia bacterium]
MSLTFSIIQTSLHWENKEANLEMLEQKIHSIPKTEIVVLPEMFSTGFSMNASLLAETMEGPTVAWMKKIASEQKIIVTGSLIIKEGQHYRNRLIWMLPNGQLGFYDKRHCFSYAGEDQFYTPGHKRLITSVKGWKIHVQICYDLRFPVWARQQPQPEKETEYDVLLYVANWPERRIHAWKSLLVARAIENQCYVVAANRIGNDGHGVYHSGDSMVVNPLGEVLFTKAHEEVIHTQVLEKRVLEEVRNRFAFWKDADGFRILNEE